MASSYSPTYPSSITRWIARHDDLIDGLNALRDLGDEAAEAVEAVISVPQVLCMRLGLELWEALVVSDGDDPDRILLEALSARQLRDLRDALWGPVPSLRFRDLV